MLQLRIAAFIGSYGDSGCISKPREYAPIAVGPAYEGYYQVDFKPVALEWYDLIEKEGMQHFTQVTILHSRVYLVISNDCYAGQEEEVGCKGWDHHQHSNAVSL